MPKQTKALATSEPDAIIAEYKQAGKSQALLDLIKAADTGDQQALANLRAVYAAAPEIASTVGSWQIALEHQIIGNTQPGVRETFTAQAHQWRQHLRGDDSTPLEKMLINRIIIDHLHALKADHLLHQKLAEPHSIDLADHYEKQADRAQRRLLRSIKALAEVRRLLYPTVQVNVADQQINFAGGMKTG